MTKKFLELINAESQNANANFVLVAFDNSFTVEKSIYNRQQHHYKNAFLRLDIDKPMNIITQFALDKGYHYLNLTMIFRDYKKTHPQENIYNVAGGTSGHFTKLGQKIAGQSISNYVIENNILKCR